MNTVCSRLVATVLAVVVTIFLGNAAQAIDRITVGIVNERPFTLSIELRDMNCGGNVVLREQLEAGERRDIEICTNAGGLGRLGATYGSGCSQVKRTNFNNIASGAALTF